MAFDLDLQCLFRGSFGASEGSKGRSLDSGAAAMSEIRCMCLDSLIAIALDLWTLTS